MKKNNRKALSCICVNFLRTFIFWLLLLPLLCYLLNNAYAQTGIITTVAGGGSPVDGLGDGGPAIEASLDFSSGQGGVFVDSAGNIFIADAVNRRIRKVDAATGIISTVAGGGSPADGLGDGGPATDAFIGPVGVFVDSAGNIFIADATNRRIRKVDAATDIISTVAGGGSQPDDGLGIGGPATDISLVDVGGVFVDSSGNIFIVQSRLGRNRILKVNAATGIISIVAGGGSPVDGLGDGGPATDAAMGPNGVFVDSAGNIFISDGALSRIRKVDAATGIISTVAGGGDIVNGSGDGGPATDAAIAPNGVFLDSSGNIFISEFNALEFDGGSIRKVDAATGIISTVAGGGIDDLGDGSLATDNLIFPVGLFVDSSGNIFIATKATDINRGGLIRKVKAPPLEMPPTPSPAQSPTPTPTPIELRPPTPPPPTPPPVGSPCFIYFSIEEPEPGHGDIFISNGWGVEMPPGVSKVPLTGRGSSVIPGGTNRELLEDFIDSPDEGIGLDGFDIIELDKSIFFNSIFFNPKHKIIFTVERDFTVGNQEHPLAGKMITDGDLLLTNGGVIRNQALIGPLDLLTRDDNEPVTLIGIDAVEVEGFLEVFDDLANKVIEDVEGLKAILSTEDGVDIIFSFEEINEEFMTGSSSLLPAGTLVSADDLIELKFSNVGVSASVVRAGADGIPVPAPDVLERCEEEERLGLDAACTCLSENMVFDELTTVWFSTSLVPTSDSFTNGDILRHNFLTAGCEVFLRGSELDSSKQMGLDGLDFFPDRPGSIGIKQFTFNCQSDFVKGPGGLDRLVLELGDNENCTLKLSHLKPGEIVKISTNQTTGLRPSIKLDPIKGEADVNGEIEFVISAIGRGIDWIAWAVPNEKGEFKFSNDAFDNGRAWGMLVIVK